MVLENCSICFNYWVSHGRYMAGYQLLIRDQHIPEAHRSRPNPGPTRPSGPSVSDLQNQLTNANNRANGLQSQLNDANSRNSSLQTQLNNANSQISSLQTQLAAANARANGLQSQLDTANSKISGLQTQLNTANSQIGSLQTQLSAANNRANDLQRQLDDSKRANKILTDEVAQLKVDKVNLENVNKALEDAGKKKDLDIKKYHTDKLTAENRIATQLEPYITMLINMLNANNITGYPPRP